MDDITRLLGRNTPYYNMTAEEFDDLAKEKLKGMRYNTPITDEGDYGKPLSRSGMNAMYMAQLALDRGVPMYPPMGPNRTYSDQQYLDTLAQQPPTNKLFSPQQDIMKRGIFAQDMARFKNELHQQTASPYYGYMNYMRELLGL
tara:strand:+ start:2072 stop:2503 length:432 start_codon:yes stop_codon:yes gene_type:complete